MLIDYALDFDDTFTRNPALWVEFIRGAARHGQTVAIVTMRGEDELGDVRRQLSDAGPPVRIFATDRKAKRPFMQALGHRVAVWIDDRPEFIIQHAAPRSLSENAKTGLWGDDS
jgi:hypothetical protein